MGIHKERKECNRPVSKTLAGDILCDLMSYRNDVQDLIQTLVVDKPTMELFRKQNFAVWESTVQGINRKLRQLGAVRPCTYCNAAGEKRDMDGKTKKCPVCKGSTWEPVI